ncbi:MAG TPA: GxxExxY protein [Vicinamibacterales bacterium]|nr:GxxExxY protein [Vicinamibacterales bacterium]
MDERDILTERIIGCAVALHRSVGPGLSERVYQRGLAIEFEFNGLRFKDRPAFNVFHRGRVLGEFFPDFIVEDEVIVEIKSVSAFDRVFEAQILTYLRVSHLRRGLLLNFGRPLMKDGIQRYVLG